MICIWAKENRAWFIKWFLQALVCVVGVIIILKVIQLSWYIPSNYDVVGKSWLNVFFEILEFYTLSGIEIEGMYFLNQWNLLSLFCVVGYMLFGVITLSCLVSTKNNE